MSVVLRRNRSLWIRPVFYGSTLVGCVRFSRLSVAMRARSIAHRRKAGDPKRARPSPELAGEFTRRRGAVARGSVACRLIPRPGYFTCGRPLARYTSTRCSCRSAGVLVGSTLNIAGRPNDTF